MTKLKLPPNCKWIDVTQEHLGKMIVMFPAEMRDGRLDPGHIEEIEIEDVEALREWLKAQ
jgi:hypothetical protein